LKINVTKFLLRRMDPTGTLWSVSVVNSRFVWKETFGSRVEVDAFIRGAKAASSMYSPKGDGEVGRFVMAEVEEQPDVEVS
jgi:hypothetical protein